jgi:hypothetical protein
MTNTPFRQKILVDFRNGIKQKFNSHGFYSLKGVFVSKDFSIVDPKIYADHGLIILYQNNNRIDHESISIEDFVNSMYPIYLIRLHHPEYLL